MHGHRVKKETNSGKKSAVGRTTHHARSKNGDLAKHIKGNSVKEKPLGKELFAERPKKPEPDNVGRRLRPAAHNAKQAGVARRARGTVKRLSDKVI